LSAVAALALSGFAHPHENQALDASPAAYLGFDSNNYPGDAALPVLRRNFSFAGYWLNRPPGGASIPWSGKRALLVRAGFGFLVLFNGRIERDLKNLKRAAQLGSSDAALAVNAAIREGFHPGTIIFVDQEEGGEMEPDQMAYLLAWTDAVDAAHFRAGIYCSGIPASAGADGMVITANDIRRRAANREISFFVYNDACPPSPGCAISNRPPAPSESGVPFASVWQFAQSPHRHQYTAACRATYNRAGNCYPPGLPQSSALIDLDSATSPDPSAARR
jgi:Rv2525c-like, glycoside hydrolase-like domain